MHDRRRVVTAVGDSGDRSVDPRERARRPGAPPPAGQCRPCPGDTPTADDRPEAGWPSNLAQLRIPEHRAGHQGRLIVDRALER